MEKPTYNNFIEQTFFELCCECLYYGYGFNYVDRCGLNERKAKKIWQQAKEWMGDSF